MKKTEELDVDGFLASARNFPLQVLQAVTRASLLRIIEKSLEVRGGKPGKLVQALPGISWTSVPL